MHKERKSLTTLWWAYVNLLVARQCIEKFQAELLPQSFKVAKLTQQGYKSGTTDFGTAVLAQRNYQTSARHLFKQRRKLSKCMGRS